MSILRTENFILYKSWNVVAVQGHSVLCMKHSEANQNRCEKSIIWTYEIALFFSFLKVMGPISSQNDPPPLWYNCRLLDIFTYMFCKSKSFNLGWISNPHIEDDAIPDIQHIQSIRVHLHKCHVTFNTILNTGFW